MDYVIGVDVYLMLQVVEFVMFMGYCCVNGQVVMCNYIGIIFLVNCLVWVVWLIVDYFCCDICFEVLVDFLNVDGVVVLIYGIGCVVDSKSELMDIVCCIMLGFVVYLNFVVVLFIGFGCEMNQINEIMILCGLVEGKMLKVFIIQDQGGM